MLSAKYLSNHVSAATNSFNTLCRKPLSSIMTLLVIAIAVMMPTVFWVISTNVEQITRNWQQSGHISLYLKLPCSTAEAESILKAVKATANVGTATLTSPKEGLEELQQQEGMEDILQYLNDNPLPPVITIIPAISVKSLPQVQTLYDNLKKIQGVDQAKIDLEWITRLYGLLHFTAKTAQTLLFILAFSVVFIIATTLRLTIHKQFEEIRVLKLIGATDAYITRPFLYSGLWYGLGGAIFAIILVNFFILQLGLSINKFTEAYKISYYFMGLSIKQAYLVLLFSVLLGWIGAKLAVKNKITFVEPYN